MQTITSTLYSDPGSTYPEQLSYVARHLQCGTADQIQIAALLFEVSGAYEYLLMDRDRLQRELDDRCRQLGRGGANWPESTRQMQQVQQASVDPAHEVWIRSMDGWATSPEGTAELAAMEIRCEADDLLLATEWKNAVEF